MLSGMSRWALLVFLIACSGGNQDNGTKPSPAPTPPPAGGKISVPGAEATKGPPPADNPQFHIQPEEGTLTVGKAEGKAGAELVASIKVEPAAGYHVSPDYPSSLK